MTEPSDDFARSDVFVTSFCQFPGQDPLEIHKVIRGELGEPNLAVFPQLVDRGMGSDALGRSASMVSDMGFDLQPHGWRIGVTDGIDARRARSLLRSDENLLADVIGAEKKPATRLKISTLGPWSLAAGLYLQHGERILIDHGARRDVLEAYADGVKQQLLRMRGSTTIQRFTVQLDEPQLPAVLDGALPTASGYRTLRSIPRQEVREVYSRFVQTLAEVEGTQIVVNLPSADEQWIKRVDILHQAGVQGYVIDPARMDHRSWERVAALVETGAQIYLQLLEPGKRAPGVVDGVNKVLRPWRQLGLPLTQLGQLTLMPAGTFANASANQVVECLQHLTGYAQALEQTRVDA
ncbi:hypothetical protein CQ010_02690 [Arthrobacter sp. MYb211]|uniref:hypothetical protein n=1 Tax=unclassified Arthrobacter TaxID=235627 RepID=UPI000CFD028E|nr:MULTISPECIES: hypothetical protein [unclassified Arthrobacter]PRA01506.1 hypothetical protein CQ017_03190 [Arthrobacter sp. MYb224]PRA06302.1 hypothetical protein CQ019_02590 [Arthrobacter sp. MYb229]PRA12761.1 hypothetical protein CQ015_05840 [Arthrobacter sp. MYb221]PRB53204.1 hypothetical protein CQ013_02590 [Arthrobacter sp. MYb216]PRC09718.1 hypothetical protein CQ010_02690 [Arthrobacter sp. MYb211]